MNTTRLRLLAVLAVPFTLGLALVADELAFKPAKDSKSQKELRIEAEFRVRDASLSFNGEPVPADVISQVTSQDLLLTIGVEVTETFLSTKDGAPTDLLRSYDALSTRFEVGDEVQEPESGPNLEGKTVRFRWSESDSAFKKTFHESTGDEDLLEALDDDMELRALLPTKKVASGDIWEVKGEKIAALFFPGGLPGGGGGDEGGPDLEAVGRELSEQLERSFRDFKVVCTYKGARDETGTQVGEVGFAYEGKASLDLAPVLQRVIDSLGEQAPDFDLSATASMTLDGEGRMLWDLASGTLHSYEMKADVTFGIAVEVSGEQQGQQIEIALSGTLGGDVTWEMKRK
ncbi:MAG: hypothetical protein JNK02_16255 [Planctomycetes bacterium]|nr:hypothetical protein [Planctomycetota bacterium]